MARYAPISFPCSPSLVCLHLPLVFTPHHRHPQGCLYYTKLDSRQVVAHMYIRRPSYSLRASIPITKSFFSPLTFKCFSALSATGQPYVELLSVRPWHRSSPCFDWISRCVDVRHTLLRKCMSSFSATIFMYIWTHHASSPFSSLLPSKCPPSQVSNFLSRISSHFRMSCHRRSHKAQRPTKSGM